MDVDGAVQAFAATGAGMPREAMGWALDHWEEAAPRFVALLDGYASGADRSEQTELALFFAVHLLAERRENSAFAPLCRLLLDAEASEMVLGDAITDTLPNVLVSLYDGELATLRAVIDADEADEYVRAGALLAMAYLTRVGVVADIEMRACLGELRAGLFPQEESFAWTAWAAAATCLGYEDLVEDAKALCRVGFIAEEWMDAADIRADLELTLRDPSGMAGFAHERVEPFGSAIETFETWSCFKPQEEREAATWTSPGRDGGYAGEQPYVNPLRHVGRNDPCPCGSGKKYKKCCLT